MSDTTFIDEVEAIAAEVAHNIAVTVEGLADALASDGRGFNRERRTPRERLVHYVETFHGNPQGQLDYIRAIVQKVLGYLKGAPAEVVAMVHPYDIAIKRAIAYSAEMEALLREEAMKARANNAGDI